MEKLKIKIQNEEECKKVYEKALELGYHYYKNRQPAYDVNIVFLDEDGDLCVQTGDPKDFMPSLLLAEFLEDNNTYLEISVEEFLKK